MKKEPIPTLPLRVALATVVLALAGACSPQGDPPRDSRPRLVLLYAPCTVNASYLSPFNQEVDFTPELASFAEDSIVFTRHQTEAGHSGTAYAALFSGTDALEHGVLSHPTNLADSLYLVSEAFSEQGYDAYFWAGQDLADETYNYGQGVPEEKTFQHGLMSVDPVFRRILEALRRDPAYRVFIATNFTVSHGPYRRRYLRGFCREYPEQCQEIAGESRRRAFTRHVQLYEQHRRPLMLNFPETIEHLGLSRSEVDQFARDVELLYKSTIHHLDSLFGDVIAEIERAELLDESLIVFTADHGELLYRENAPFKWLHGWQLVPESLTVPLIIRSPALTGHAGKYHGVTRSIDVFPTLAGLAGLSIPEEHAGKLMGVDLTPVLSGREPAASLLAFSHTTLLDESLARMNENLTLWRRLHGGVDRGRMWVSIRDGDRVYKYGKLDGEGWGFQVFDLSRDPREERNLYDAADPQHRSMAERLLDYSSRLNRRWEEKRGGQRQDEEAIRRLRNLGYIE